ncbi:MAG: family N-acetyltransferase [Mucilaginibacter sp.]|nr:family N-acetyltransferase [Mucilaginibacter sp.]
MIPKFNPEANYILEDDRVLLRPLQADDFENLLPFAINEPDTWKYSLTSAKGADGMQNYLDTALKEKADGKEYPFIVYDKKTSQYAGCTRFYDIQPQLETLQLGYTWYGEQFRGTGLNKHCKFLLLQFAFETLNIKRVEFRADARNERSIAAMKSLGCKVDGILRSNMPLQDGGRRDSIVLRILQPEWQQEVKEHLKGKL